MAEVKKIIRCIVCPEGCMINAIYNETESVIESIDGYQCKRGVKFAEEEIKNPTRVLTTTVAIDAKNKKRLSVRSAVPVPKNMLKDMVLEAKKVRVLPPVKMGDILSRNFLGTGVDLIASETVYE